ncbi:polysaccharide export protein EpsE [Ketobacter sp. MCCC 1A13808]|nr:polysaccharide export protein EpsE [Ketobacter sp. MCCC 1A13808]RLP53435.1 MAG: polysaccharide export protein EpsE [Ketobacter sp.]
MTHSPSRIKILLVPFFMFFVTLLTSFQASAVDARSLSVGDVVKISVYGQSDLTTVTRISENNSINFPLIGEVVIGGLSVGTAEDLIEHQLSSKGFVKNPQVNLFVEQLFQTLNNTVTILGHVEKPGNYVLQGASVEGVRTLVHLIAAAGGLRPEASNKGILTRVDGKNRERFNFDLYEMVNKGTLESAEYKLQGGDVVYIPEMDVFYIYGQVQQPGRYRLEQGMRVMQALPVAGGITDHGSEKGIQIQRNVNGKIKTLDVNPTDEVLKDDVVYVKESFF